MTAVSPIVKPEAGRARIWNHGKEEHVEKFRDEVIRIPAGGSVDMDYYDAVLFMGQWYPSVKNDAGEYIKCKPLKMQKLFSDVQEATGFISHADGKIFATEKELKAHLDENKDKFVPQVNEELDKKLAAQSQKNDDKLTKLLSVLENLNDRITALEAPKKKGRPKRDSTRDHHSGEAGEQ